MYANELAQQIAQQRFPALDHGYVQLIDLMGTEQSIIASARRSYADASKQQSSDRDFIRYLVRHNHWKPFERARLVVELEVPIYVLRQIDTYRTASKHEFSGRYSEYPAKFHQTKPDAWRLQSKDNKQGSAGFLPEYADKILDDSTYRGGSAHCAREQELLSHAQYTYQQRLSFGIAREQARKDLPLSQYTQCHWGNDLRNVFHFLSERLPGSGNPQHEISEYATALYENIVKPLFPLSCDAFEDYKLYAMTLSQDEISWIRSITLGHATLIEITKREQAECRAKLVCLGLIEAEGGEA